MQAATSPTPHPTSTLQQWPIALALCLMLSLSASGCGPTLTQMPFEKTIPTERPAYLTHFVTTWQGTTVTLSAGKGTFNYDVDWDNDLIFDDVGLTGPTTHTFDTRGPHTIRVRGHFPHMDSFQERQGTLLSVDQWGTGRWKSMKHMFRNRRHLTIKAKDTPNTSQVTDMSFMFAGAEAFNGDIRRDECMTSRLGRHTTHDHVHHDLRPLWRHRLTSQ